MALALVTGLLVPALLFVGGFTSLPSLVERGVAWLIPGSSHQAARGGLAVSPPAARGMVGDARLAWSIEAGLRKGIGIAVTRANAVVSGRSPSRHARGRGPVAVGSTAHGQPRVLPKANAGASAPAKDTSPPPAAGGNSGGSGPNGAGPAAPARPSVSVGTDLSKTAVTAAVSAPAAQVAARVDGTDATVGADVASPAAVTGASVAATTGPDVKAGVGVTTPVASASAAVAPPAAAGVAAALAPVTAATPLGTLSP